ncbi:hypothetical protein WJX74_010756 [Apatococcus lobatus]|uniref:Uncharacterized protein n=1 Tax=Apatococcus lobatus TaxID=904363 RepID=A0AAW1QIL1_9CHLO
MLRPSHCQRQHLQQGQGSAERPGDLAVLLGHFLKLPPGGASLTRAAQLRQLLGAPCRVSTEAAARELHDVTKQALGLIHMSFGAESIKLGAVSMQSLVSIQERGNVLASFA